MAAEYARMQQAPAKANVREAETEKEQTARARSTRRPARSEAAEPKVEQTSEIQAQELRRIAAEHVAEILAAEIRKRGYLPPEPFPLVQMEALHRLKDQLRAIEHHESFPVLSEVLSNRERELQPYLQSSADFLCRTIDELQAPSSVVSRAKMFIGRIHSAIDEAQISLAPPLANPTLQKRMRTTELFLAGNWHQGQKRGILAIHVDEEHHQTILQVGLAEHGVLYLTIPRVLRPEDIARNSMQELIKRLQTLSGTADPLAVIDGAYQGMNFNYLFAESRVIRAPSGNTTRLSANLAELSARERLSAENTAILNSSPRSRDEYVRVLRDDKSASHWPAWAAEATTWETMIGGSGFATTPESSRQAFIEAVTEKQNVIVIVAHCDGKSLFMPHPDPDGTVITAEYLIENREEIARNKPMVCLFSCHAGDLDNMANFASTLLDCGAAGVIASQTNLGAAEGLEMMKRLLADDRRTPPLEDIWRAMHESQFLEMEVFLA